MLIKNLMVSINATSFAESTKLCKKKNAEKLFGWKFLGKDIAMKKDDFFT
jgi:hypothetical protein